MLQHERLLHPLVRRQSSTTIHAIASADGDLRSDRSGATPTLFEKEFSLSDRVALVSGANRGLGLEMSMALIEAGARVVYCLDLPQTPGDEFDQVKRYVGRMEGKGRLEYVSADVRDQVCAIASACRGGLRCVMVTYRSCGAGGSVEDRRVHR